MNDNLQPESPATRWFRLAQEDLDAARAILGVDEVAPRIACFLSQQAAEKALKAGLISLNVQFPKIHGLTRLLDLYPKNDRPRLNEDGLDMLDPWNIEARYAADLPAVEPAGAGNLVAIAGNVVESVRVLLTE